MERSQTNDFIASSSGRCFFCLNRTNKSFKDLEESFHSLQYLSKYLKVDRKKVFSEEVPIPPDLLNIVEKSVLKVELCTDCAFINGKLAQMLEQLEKLKIEANFYLDSFYSKLFATKYSGKLSNDHGTNCNRDEKLEIVERLRAETLQKCKKIYWIYK